MSDEEAQKKLFEALDSLYAALPETHRDEFVTIVRREFLYGKDVVGRWLKSVKEK